MSTLITRTEAEKEALPAHLPNCRQRYQAKCGWPPCRNMRAANLRKPEHQQPPDGYQSCTSKNAIEVVVYKDNHAYPAYIFSYLAPSLSHFNPYADVSKMTRINWTHRGEHVVDFEHARLAAAAGLVSRPRSRSRRRSGTEAGPVPNRRATYICLYSRIFLRIPFFV